MRLDFSDIGVTIWGGFKNGGKTMRVEYGKESYLVSFRHEFPGKEEKDGYRKTVCEVYRLGPRKSVPPERELISTGVATCSPLDQFQKEVGRKVSLTRALQETAPSLNKDFRAAIWKTYFNRKPPENT